MKALSIFLVLLNILSNLSLPNQNYSVQRRVTHGRRPPSFNYPYTSQARLYLISTKQILLFCTGTIITDRVVLTAAHCIAGKVSITVGYNSYFFVQEGLTSIPAVKWYEHPHYGKKDLDVGLVVTAESMLFTNQVQAAYPARWITDVDDLRNHSRPSVMCGWGATDAIKLGLRLNCLKYPALDQRCLNNDDNVDFNWCFYAEPVDVTKNIWANACFGDAGAGIFPGK